MPMKLLSYPLTLIVIAFTATINNTHAQTGPGGVGNSSTNKIWYDAYQQNLTNGAQVASVTDFSGNGNHATQSVSSQRPTFATNQSAGMPAFLFNGAQSQFVQTGSISALNTNTISWYIITKSANNYLGIAMRSAYSSGAGSASSTLWGSYMNNVSGQFISHTRNSAGTMAGSVNGYTSNYNVLCNIWDGSTSQLNSYFNGSAAGSFSGANSNPTGHIHTRLGSNSGGSSSGGVFYKGHIAEVAVYTTALNITQRTILDNYFGNKYGISISNDLFAFQATHRYDIAGVGQTSASDNHLTAQGSSIFEFSNPATVTDGSFFIWGHNNLTPATDASDVPPGILTRLNRTWRADKTGTINNFTVRVDVSALLWADPMTYALLIDSDGTFSNATTHTTGISFDGTYLTFTGVNINDGDFFTVASTAPNEIISVTTGDWHTTSTWNCSCVPGPLANVTIINTHNVSINNSTAIINDVTIDAGGILTINNSETLQLSGTINSFGSFVANTGTVNYYGENAQTVAPVNYFNLTSSGTGARVLSSSGTIGVAGVFTPGTNAYTNTGSTINYNSSSSQNITQFNYFNLASSSTGARILPSSVGIAGSFTPGTNTYTTTGNTVVYNGTSAQTIAAFDYNNLTSSSTGSRTFASSGIVRIFGTFIAGSNVYTITPGSTVEFAGASTQSIPAIQYFNLSSTGASSRNINAGHTRVNGNFTPGTNTYSVNASSTLNFNGNSAQAIPAFNYASMAFSGSGIKTLNGNINVSGNITNSGATVNGGTSTLTFNGSTNQSISGNVNFNNLAITKSGGNLSLASGNLTLRGLLSINTNTNFNVSAGSFTMLSDATSTAAIAPVLNGGTISGNFIIQRFVPAGNNNWMTLTAPVVSSTLADWDNELFLSGIGGNEGFFPGPPFYSVYEWSETAQDYAAVTTTTATLQAGKGYEVWMCGSNPDMGFTRPNTTFNSIANPYVGVLNMPLSYNASGDYPGQHLVGNPYPAHLNLNLLTGNIADEFYIFDDDIGEAGDYYAYWDKASQTGTGDLASSGGIIAPHQGFWVTANAATSLGFTENMKTSSTSSSSWVGKQEMPELSVRINKQNSLKGSRAFVRFNDVSTKNFDEFDKQFRLPVPPNIPTISILTDDNKKLIVNSVNEYENSYALPLSVKSGTQGIYQLSINKQNITTAYSCYMIEDTKLNKKVNVSDGAYYEVALNNNEKIDNRFILHISKDDCIAEDKPSGIYANNIDNKVGVFGHEQGAVVVFGYNETVNANISVYNTLGQLISQPLSQNISNDRVILNLPTTTQVYIIRVEVNGEVLTQRVVR
jgi:hypothetical protein